MNVYNYICNFKTNPQSNIILYPWEYWPKFSGLGRFHAVTKVEFWTIMKCLDIILNILESK